MVTQRQRMIDRMNRKQKSVARKIAESVKPRTFSEQWISMTDEQKAEFVKEVNIAKVMMDES